jgi:hypothetical protein
MSGKVMGAVSAKSVSAKSVSAKAVPHKAVSQKPGQEAAVSKADASARWAALDSRYERLVGASDALLADAGRCGDLKAAS